MRKPKKASRCAALIATMAAIAGGIQLATPPPAAAISGLQRAPTGLSRIDNEPVKRASAECPTGKHVIGGGAWVSDGGRKLVRLTWLVPVSLGGSSKDGFIAEAEAPNLHGDFSWSLAAYAICADKSALTNYRIVSDSVESSATFQTAAARCPSGTVAFGAGAGIFTGPDIDLRLADVPGTKQGQIGLQLNRTSGPLDISRAAARESVIGHAGQWTLASYAVCAQPRGQIHAEGTIAPGAQATNKCQSGFTHGPGGGGGLSDGGPVWLQKIYPHYDLRRVDVGLTGLTYPSIGGMVAKQTCAL